MSIGLKEVVFVAVPVSGIVAVAERVWTGGWSWAWIGYFWGGYFALMLVVFVGIWAWAGIDYLRGGEERARQKRLITYHGKAYIVDSPGEKGPWNHATIRLFPDFPLIETEYELEDLREPVEDAVSRLKRDVAPAEWVAKAPGMLSAVLARGYVLRGPVSWNHVHDPGPSSPPPPRAT
jgi:hypothetical protein